MFQHTLETRGILVNLEQTNPSVLQNDETVKNCYLHYFLFQNFLKLQIESWVLMKTTTATTTNCSMADVKIKSHDVNTSGHRWADRK